MTVRTLAVRLGGIVVVVVAATACAWILFHLLRPELFRGPGNAGSKRHWPRCRIAGCSCCTANRRS